MNSAAKSCSRCNAPIQQAGVWGLCTKCLYDESILAQNDGEHRAPPTKFGDYELVRPIGRGGMGVVYEAIQVSLGRRVALKMILDAEGASPKAFRRFTLEAETVARLDHPNIVPLYQIGEVNGHPFLSMKLISGETLRKKIANREIGLGPESGQLSREQFVEKLGHLVRLMIKVADAVEHAHEHGILHRDLKPSNILVDQAGQPHLLDFGLAKIVQEDGKGPPTEPTATIGTPSYMSPEQAQGKRLTVASDIHGLGAILYELLSGVPPFGAPTALETLKKTIEHHPVRPRSLNTRIDKDIDTICMKCLEKIPEARYRSARALAEDLDRWQRHEPIRARPVAVPLRVTRWVNRNRLGTALIASLCLGLTVALLFLGQSIERQKKLDLRRGNSLQMVSSQIDQMWKNPRKRFVPIPSAMLADLADLPPRAIDALNIPLTFGTAITRDPIAQALHSAPFLHELEAKMEKKLGRSVVIDLTLFKFESDALAELGRGETQLQRMPPLAYVLAKRTWPNLKPLVRERSKKWVVIFAGGDSGITNLSQVGGKRLVLTHPTSEAAFWGKVHLARSGLTYSNLASYKHLGGDADVGETAAAESKTIDPDPNQQAHKRVVQKVINGHADVGIASERQFELWRYRKHGLIELSRFQISGDVYVASPQVSSETAEALRESLASFSSTKDREKIPPVAENATEGFERVSDDDFAAVRAALDKEIADFERSSAPRPKD